MYGNVYNIIHMLSFIAFWLSFPHIYIIFEASNLTITLILICFNHNLNFVVKQHVWGVFSTYEDELVFHMYGNVCSFIAFWSSFPHTPSLKLQTWPQPFFFNINATNHNCKFRSWPSNMFEVYSVQLWGWARFHTHELNSMCTHFIVFLPSFPRTSSLKLQTWSQPLFWYY